MTSVVPFRSSRLLAGGEAALSAVISELISADIVSIPVHVVRARQRRTNLRAVMPAGWLFSPSDGVDQCERACRLYDSCNLMQGIEVTDLPGVSESAS